MKRKLVYGALAVVLALPLAACGSSSDAGESTASSQPSSEAPADSSSAEQPESDSTATDDAEEGDAPADEIGAPEKTKLTIGISLPNVDSNAPVELAIANGYYADEGLEVEVVRTDSTTEGLVGGSLDFAVVDSFDLIHAAQSGTGVKLVSGYRSRDAYHIATQADISSPADLAGKPVLLGATAGTLEYEIRTALMKDAGFDVDGVSFNAVSIPGGSNAWVEQFLDNKLDMTVFFARHRAMLEEVGAHFVLDINKDWPDDSIGATESFMSANPNAAARFLRATIRGADFWMDDANWQEALSIMEGRDYKIDQAEADDIEVFHDGQGLYGDGTANFCPNPAEFLDKLEFASKLPAMTIQVLPLEDYSDLSALTAAKQSLGQTC